MNSKRIYINGYFFKYLSDLSSLNDRVEFYRDHEQSLWTIYQVLKAGNNEVIVASETKIQEKFIANETDFKNWVKETYPGFESQLDNKTYTRFPHPDAML